MWLFGSRVHDDARGGDINLMLKVDSPVPEPAQLSAALAARVSRTMFGRKVDVLIKAPNLLHLPIHDVALAQGVRLKRKQSRSNCALYASDAHWSADSLAVCT